MKFSSVLIITYGRSGSTLLQGILNSIDGCLIRGENENMCYHLFKCYQAIKEAKKQNGKLSQHPWFGGYLLNEQLFLSQCKNLVYTLLLVDQAHDPSIKCFGFKEIRYTLPQIGNDLELYLSFLKDIFPNVAFVFNTRNLHDVAKSEWWAAQDKKDVIEMLTKTESNFSAFIKRNPQNTFHITYEDIISKSDKFKEMYHFLGTSYDEKTIDTVLEKPHSYKTKNKSL